MRATAVLASLALSIFAVSAQAQTLDTSVKAFNGPVTEYDYDLATGTITKTLPGPASAPLVVYDNTFTNNFFFTPGPGVKVMDWGNVTTSGHNCITDFSFAYATDFIGTVDLAVHFTSGAIDTLGFCELGSALPSFLFTGLPGSVAGEVVANAFNVNLSGSGDCFDLPDGDVGYAYEFFDTDTGPLLIGPPNEAGVSNAFDRYDLSDVCLGTFFFGGTPFASFWMELTGHQSYEAFPSTCVGAGGVAPLLLMSGCACAGGTVGYDLTGGQGGALAALMFDLNLGTTNLGSGCTIDVSFPSQIFLVVGAMGGFGAGQGSLSFSATLPPAMAPGTILHTQVLIQDSTVGLITSNGITMSVAP